MRVAIIVPRISQAGPMKVIQALVNSMYENDEIQIKVFYLDKVVDPVINMRVPVERLVTRQFRFENYDIIHTNGIRPDLFAFLNRRKIRYHISTIHNFVFDDLTFAYNKLISWIFGSIWLLIWLRADKLVCVSKAMKEYYTRWFSDSNLEVIYNGIAEIEDFSECDAETIITIECFRSRGLKVIGSAGILTKRKGIDQILDLLAIEKDLALVIIGDGKEFPRLQQITKKLKISDRCQFCGFRSNAVNYFKYFDIIIVPSRSEGYGLVLAEAVQQKTPVICSDLKVFKELFNANEVTFFKLEDLSSLIKALKVAKETGKIKADMAYTSYQKKYTAKLMAKSYFELYQSAYV
jgi:L-malate glycosyltransferase